MATQLRNIVQFVNVPAGAMATLPHYLNLDGVGLVPDLVMQARNVRYRWGCSSRCGGRALGMVEHLRLSLLRAGMGGHPAAVVGYVEI